MTEAAFNQLQQDGKVEPVLKNTVEPDPVGIPPLSSDEYQTVLEAIRKPRIYLSTPPTFEPKTFAESIQYYDDGTNQRVYFYFNGAWNYVSKKVTEDEIILSDVTTNDVSPAQHGFAPKAPNDPHKFLNGANLPAWEVPPYPVSLKASGIGTALSMTISGLDLNSDENYLIVARYVNGNSGTSGPYDVRIRINGDTGANYKYIYNGYSNSGGGAANQGFDAAASVIKCNTDVTNNDADGQLIIHLNLNGANRAALNFSLFESGATLVKTEGGAFYSGAANITSIEIGSLGATTMDKAWEVYVYKYSLV